MKHRIASSTARRGLQRIQLIYASVGALCLAGVAVAAWISLGRGDALAPGEGAAKKPGVEVGSKVTVAEGDPLASPEFATISVRVVTPKEPGFLVLVDGEAARAADGKPIETPCSITLSNGKHRVSVVRKGYHETGEEVTVDTVTGGTDNPTEIVIEPEYEPFTVSDAYLKSPFTQAQVGEPFELTALNADGRAYDPCVSPDGLTIFFAAERTVGRGIYMATRPTVYEEFSEAELIEASSGSTPVASPSVTPDLLTVAFVVPDKGRIWTLTRSSPDGAFDKSSQPLKYRGGETEIWRSIQLVDDGSKLYCVRQEGPEAACHVASRIGDTAGKSKKKSKKSNGGGDAKGYGNWKSFPMPGTHPHLSLDGLRQYEFDGKSLTRATRQSTATAFTPPQTIVELAIENYVQRADYRQFWVTDDEQWLFYSHDPREDGRLFAARLSNGPGWGFASRGKPLPAGSVIARGTDKPADDSPTPDKPSPEEPSKPAAPAAADPRSQLLPYVAFRAQFESLLAKRDFESAEKLVRAMQADPAHEQDREVLAWDLDEVRNDLGFWKDLDRALTQIKPGETIRMAGTSGEFTKFEKGVIEIKTRVKPLEKSLTDLPSGDLVALAERAIDRADEAAQLRIAAFLRSEPKAAQSLIKLRLDKAGVGGREFGERQARRKLHIIQLEFARENIGEGLVLIDDLVAFAPKSEAATQALGLRESLYTTTVWRPLGNMKWDTTTPGVFATTEPPETANDTKKKKKSATSLLENSYLISPRIFRNFQLALEWKTTGEAAHGGVYFRYAGQGPPRGNAFKIHFANDFASRANADRFSTGALFGLQKPASNAVKRDGEWNTLVLRVESDRVRAKINNVDVLDAPLSDPKIPDTGYVCLEGETPGVTYRRVLVYELPGHFEPAQKKPQPPNE
jgi:hypothetical protein